jgi:DNA integrity scanning protein DisA with diadenylate cyclase activity
MILQERDGSLVLINSKQDMVEFFVERMKDRVMEDRNKRKKGVDYLAFISTLVVEVLAGLAFTSNDLSCISAYISDLDRNCRELFFQMQDVNDTLGKDIKKIFEDYGDNDKRLLEIRKIMSKGEKHE